MNLMGLPNQVTTNDHKLLITLNNNIKNTLAKILNNSNKINKEIHILMPQPNTNTTNKQININTYQPIILIDEPILMKPTSKEQETQPKTLQLQTNIAATNKSMLIIQLLKSMNLL